MKPRSAAEDWFAVGFDPWSAGREPLSAEFIPTLSIKQVNESLGGSSETCSSISRLRGRVCVCGVDRVREDSLRSSRKLTIPLQ